MKRTVNNTLRQSLPQSLHFIDSIITGHPSPSTMYRRNMFQQQRQQQRFYQRRQNHAPPPPPPPPKFQRPWDDCVTPMTASVRQQQPHLDITLMSYNVLAQHLIDAHPELYAEHQSWHLNWTHRLRLIIAHVASLQPDVLCLQEVQQCHLGQFANALRVAANLGAYVYQKRTGTATLDGCATFYRTDRLELHRSHCVEYNQPQCKQLLDRPNVAVLTHFRSCQRPAVQFVVANTHLLFNPKREDVRVAQTQVLLAELDRFAYLGVQNGTKEATATVVHAPCIVTGDLNAAPYSATVELLTKGRLAYASRMGSRLRTADGETAAAPSSSAPVTSSSSTKRQSKPLAYGDRLLPLELGITDGCQHGAMALGPLTDCSTDMSSTWVSSAYSRLVDVSYPKIISLPFQLFNSRTNNICDTPNTADILQTGLPFRTGTLRHQFEFRSVYEIANNDKNNSDSDPATAAQQTASTFHDYWLTVDHILYSARPPNNVLRLLARLRLPTIADCEQHIGRMPNGEYGSDHLSLAARFRVAESPAIVASGAASEASAKR